MTSLFTRAALGSHVPNRWLEKRCPLSPGPTWPGRSFSSHAAPSCGRPYFEHGQGAVGGQGGGIVNPPQEARPFLGGVATVGPNHGLDPACPGVCVCLAEPPSLLLVHGYLSLFLGEASHISLSPFLFPPLHVANLSSSSSSSPPLFPSSTACSPVVIPVTFSVSKRSS